jgi:hypothetical protein
VALLDLQFQADMGILLAFMFLVNAFGAILLAPALAAFLLRAACPRAAAARMTPRPPPRRARARHPDPSRAT